MNEAKDISTTDSEIKSIDNYVQIAILGEGQFGLTVIKYQQSDDKALIVGKLVSWQQMRDATEISSRSIESVYILSHIFDLYLFQRLSGIVRECETLHSLKHDRIIQLFGVYSDKHQVILFSEFLPNGSVKDQLRKEALPELTAIKYFFQTADAVQYLHSCEPCVIHSEIRGNRPLIDP